MTLPASITYHVLSDETLTKLIEEASVPDRLLRESSACKRFDISRDFLLELVRDGKIQRVCIPGRAKSIRYSEKQIQNIFKQL